MKLRIEDRVGYTFVKVQDNRMDILLSSVLKEKLFSFVQDDGVKNIVLDLSKCIYCDSAGLSAILSIHRMCNNAGGTFIVTNIHEDIDKLIKICMLDILLNIAENSDDIEAFFASNIEIV